MKNILITGGTGLIGRKLIDLLVKKNYEPRVLSRKKTFNSQVITYKWIPEKNIIDRTALIDVDVIIHLAGANIGEKRWTKRRKTEIIESRTKTAELLYEHIKQIEKKPKLFISASAVGIYPVFSSGEEYYIENDMLGTNFTAEVCKKWEEAVDIFENIGIKTVKVRTGIVLDKNNPAFSKIIKSQKFGILPVFGSENQFFPWIHIEDVVSIYEYIISKYPEIEKYKVVNAVAPQTITNIEYIRSIKKINGKGTIIKIPSFLLKIMFGEMSEILTKGTKIKSILENSDFNFKYPDIDSAIKNILDKK